LRGLRLEDERVLMGTQHNEDAAVLRFPPGMALVQTMDFFTPIVNNPYWFGQIAAANSLSDVYALGATPLCAMNIVCFPIKKLPKEILREILRGGRDKLAEAGAVLAGGHSVEDEEIKYGLSVSGYAPPDGFASNGALEPGDILLLTKPLGTGVLATALKAKWPDFARFEELLYQWAGRLNKAGGETIRALGLRAATDVTGFGLGGHALEMARASNKRIELWAKDVPILPHALELADMGLIPAGSYANKHYCGDAVRIDADVPTTLADMIFDAQTSGGLILGVPEDKVSVAQAMLLEAGDLAAPIGRVLPDAPAPGPRLLLRAAKP
jgi:selenide,water dikinase